MRARKAARICPSCAHRARWFREPPHFLRLRYPPHGDVDEWIKYGPQGAPVADMTHCTDVT